MPAHDVDEQRITLGGPDGHAMPDHPEQQTGQPQAQPKTEDGGQRAVEDCDRPWRTAEQDRFGQGSVHWHHEARKAFHQTRTPPPNEKKDRKKLEAAKAMEMPKTIWIRRR